ncbi:MAG: DUF2282 domain-containing protein [Alphaproteobacteria bacterium]|nr:DUF2282 domain-containing protein [Alphaproteobacteria bacterium]
MVSKKTVNTLLAGAIAFTIAGAAASAQASGDMEGKEKCFGVVKAGHNDCGNAGKTHSCAGMASVDGGSDEWVALPEGTCEKLVGGSLEAHAGDGEEAHDVVEGQNADHGASH